MATLTVILDLDPFEQDPPGFGSGGEPMPIDTLTFEAGKERFGGSIVPAVALAAHTANNARFLEALLIVAAGIRTAAVAVTEKTRSGVSVG